MKLTTLLYRLARLSNDMAALSSGNPRRIARRGRNILIGRTLRRAGFFRWLWK